MKHFVIILILFLCVLGTSQTAAASSAICYSIVTEKPTQQFTRLPKINHAVQKVVDFARKEMNRMIKRWDDIFASIGYIFGGSFGISTLVFIVFLVLKLAQIGVVANWSWLWVTSPLWIPIAVVIAFFVVYFLIIIVGALIAILIDAF